MNWFIFYAHINSVLCWHEIYAFNKQDEQKEWTRAMMLEHKLPGICILLKLVVNTQNCD